MSGFAAMISAVSAEMQADMRGRSWHPDPRCPAFASLRVIRLRHWAFDGSEREGELVVAADVAEAVVDVFGRLFAARFPIARMARIDAYFGDDERSMAANNCSSFNFRTIAGRDTLSQHAFGAAIDINPVQNPYVVGGRIYPAAGADYLDRSRVRPGMIVRPGPVTDAFDAIGWEWGGDWTRTKDYHHFCAPT